MTTRSAPRRTRRGAPEVVEKRRAARHFNDVLLSKGGAAAHDGRTERRRKRLYRELERAAAGERPALKPLDVLKRVEELLELGEPVARIRKAYPPRPLLEARADLVEGLRRLHRAYGFRVDVYRFVGLGEELVAAAGVVATSAAKPTKSTAAAKAGRVEPKEPRPSRAARAPKAPKVAPRPPARAKSRARASNREEDAA